MKTCVICGREFQPQNCRVKTCGKECSQAYDRARRQTPEYKAYDRAHKQTPEYKAYQRAYEQTPQRHAYRRSRERQARAIQRQIRFAALIDALKAAV